MHTAVTVSLCRVDLFFGTNFKSGLTHLPLEPRVAGIPKELPAVADDGQTARPRDRVRPCRKKGRGMANHV